MGKLYDQLAKIIDERHLASQDFAIYAIHADAGFEKGGFPEVIVRAQTTEHVAAILKLANRLGTVVTVRGGASSAAGSNC